MLKVSATYARMAVGLARIDGDERFILHGHNAMTYCYGRFIAQCFIISVFISPFFHNYFVQ